MRITYDKQADAMSIRFNKKRSLGVTQISDFLNVRLAEDGSVISIELLDVSKFADDIDTLVQQYDIEKVREAERVSAQAK